VYHMFKKSNFPAEAEDHDELKIFRNIRRYKIFIVESHDVVFPCVDAIIWIINHVDLENRCVCNARGEPITSF